MDSLDAALLRGLLRDHSYNFTGIDPRRSASTLAEYASVSRNAVQTRLNSWKESGFFPRSAVFVNPDLFGLSFSGQIVLVEHGSERQACETELRELEHLFLLFEIGPMFATLDVFPHSRALEGRSTRLRRYAHIKPLTPIFPVEFPASEMRPGRVDLEIIRALRGDSSIGTAELASKLGISTRSVRRRLDRMIDGNCLFFFPCLDFTKGKGSVLWLTLLVPADIDRNAVLETVYAKHPDAIHVSIPTPIDYVSPAPPTGTPSLRAIQLLLPVRTAQQSEPIQRNLCTIPQIQEVMIGLPTRNFDNGACFDRLLFSYTPDPS